jgi:hypothetical protein
MSFKKFIMVAVAALLLCSAQLLVVTQVFADDGWTDPVDASFMPPLHPPLYPPYPALPPCPPTPPPLPPTPPPLPPIPPQQCCQTCSTCCSCYPRCSSPCECSWTSCPSRSIVVVQRPQPMIDPPPVINVFSANPSYIQSGQTAVLTWNVSDELSRPITVTITPSVGSVASSGSYSVTPGSTTTYTLTATNVDGTVSASTTVTVANLILSAPSSSSQMTTAADTPDTTNILTSGLSTLSDNFGMMVILLGLLAVAAAVAVALLVRRPAAARAGNGRGYAAATRTAGRTPATTPVDSGPRFVMSNGEAIPLFGGRATLGRSDFSSQVRADEADLISRRHLRFDYEDGEYYIEDRGSTNGTRINGSSIEGKGRYLLKDGDKVEVADVLTLTFKS